MSHVARHVTVTGQVQGVFFRAWTAEQATNLGVSGWVRNAPDGSVEAHVQGEQWPVQQLIDLLRRGPPSAQVAQLMAEESELGAFDGFQIRH
jgi:acylphosphatase